MKLTGLRTLNAEHPIGVGKKVYFAWRMESDEENTKQISYRITVKNKATGEVVMDSGEVLSDELSYIAYSGKPLESRCEYEWAVSVSDNKGNKAEETASFETGLLEAEDWKALWVTPAAKRKANKPGFGKQQPSVVFRQDAAISVTSDNKIVKARLYATAHGAYEVYINGKRPDERFFAPEHTVYEKYLCYQTYDVTELLVDGDNTIDMHVGNGWYFSPNAAPNLKTDGQLAVLFQLEVTLSDGQVITVVSDENVTTAAGKVASTDLYSGELYDANRAPGDLQPVKVRNAKRVLDNSKAKNYGYDNLKPQNTDKVMAVKQVPVKEMIRNSKGECILDFGQNMAGVIKISVNSGKEGCLKLAKGQRIRLEHCEVLDKENSYFNNIMAEGGVGKGCDQITEYVSDGHEAVYVPHFTYQGFRYARVTIDGKNPGDINPEDFTALLLSTEKKSVGTFECSDEDLNRFYMNTRWSQASNMISIPTDCPQREKAGWTGDMLVYSKTAMLNEDCTPMFSRWLENMEADQDKYGIVPMVVPENGSYPMMGKFINMSCGAKGKGTSSGWGDAAVIVPYSMYQVSGNREVLKQQYMCMRRWCDYVIKTAEEKKPKGCSNPDELEKYLWDTGYHYGEWLIPSQNKNGLDTKNLKAIMAASSCYTAPIFGWNSVNTFADIIEILLEAEPDNALYATDLPKYRSVADSMKKAIRACVTGANGSTDSKLQGAYVLPLYFDLVEEDKKETIVKRLIELIEQNGMCMDTGFLGTPYLLDSLQKIGRTDIALSMLLNEQVPSWLSEVKAGGTTIWENCFGYDTDGNPGRLSFNHYSFGCVDDWIFRNINGIIPTSAGYNTFKVNPVIDAIKESNAKADNNHKITYARRSFETANGTIVVNWSLDDDKYKLHVEVPVNTKATIVMPSGKTVEVGSGVYDYE